MKKLALFLSILLFIGILAENTQSKQITSAVTSFVVNAAIPGVSVTVKGTTLGTITNIDGVFELKVPEDAQIPVANFVGKKTTEVELALATDDNVLKSIIFGINEVGVTALNANELLI